MEIRRFTKDLKNTKDIEIQNTDDSLLFTPEVSIDLYAESKERVYNDN